MSGKRYIIDKELYKKVHYIVRQIECCYTCENSGYDDEGDLYCKKRVYVPDEAGFIFPVRAIGVCDWYVKVRV